MHIKKTLYAGVAVLSGFTFLASTFAAETKPAAEMPKQEQRAVDNAQPERVSNQIAELHAKLHITTDQESKWSEVAEAMTETAKQVRTKLTDRAEKVKTANLTAVDELRAYQDLQQVQYEGVKRLIGPFSTLYDSMSPAQKKSADELFEEPHEQAAAGGGASGKHMEKSQ